MPYITRFAIQREGEATIAPGSVYPVDEMEDPEVEWAEDMVSRGYLEKVPSPAKKK